MNIGGVIAEYNPFHSGHQYQLDQMRKNGMDRIAVVMSGNFVQRGDVAIQSKFTRAMAAIQGGADLVIELPVPFSLASAEHFAYGGIYLLRALGCVGTLSFGCEDNELPLFHEIVRVLARPETDAMIRTALEKGISYPAARGAAVQSLLGTHAHELLKKPNNILAIEYLKAAEKLNVPFEYLPILRKGAGHDSSGQLEGFLSASEIRRTLCAGVIPAGGVIPAASLKLILQEMRAGRLPATTQQLERIILYVLRQSTAEALCRLPDVSEGLEGRILNAAKTSNSLLELTEAIKSKRYPLARIRRILMAALLGITREDLTLMPPYIRVLACNTNGFDILRKSRTTARLPIVMRANDVRRLDSKSREYFARECRFDDIYALSCPNIQACGLNQTTGVQIIK
ncbi:MAG: nucleotidyltransferase family protein [Clostridia bacterium]